MFDDMACPYSNFLLLRLFYYAKPCPIGTKKETKPLSKNPYH